MRGLYRITTYRAAGSALWSCSDYRDHREQHLPKRNDGKPGEKLLCWSHCERNSSMIIEINRSNAKAAGTTVKSLLKAYPSDWYTATNKGVWVTFPDSIRYGSDLRDFALAS